MSGNTITSPNTYDEIVAFVSDIHGFEAPTESDLSTIVLPAIDFDAVRLGTSEGEDF